MDKTTVARIQGFLIVYGALLVAGSVGYLIRVITS